MTYHQARALGLLRADSGEEEDFLTRITGKQKVEKSLPRWEMNCPSKGVKNGTLTKFGVEWQKTEFWAKN